MAGHAVNNGPINGVTAYYMWIYAVGDKIVGRFAGKRNGHITFRLKDGETLLGERKISKAEMQANEILIATVTATGAWAFDPDAKTLVVPTTGIIACEVEVSGNYSEQCSVGNLEDPGTTYAEAATWDGNGHSEMFVEARADF
jgi:hypothetical protein